MTCLGDLRVGSYLGPAGMVVKSQAFGGNGRQSAGKQGGCM